jgi:hypothetical protein
MAFDRERSSRPSFMALPVNVRELIYIYAGLVRLCPIDVANEHSQWHAHAKGVADWMALDPQGPPYDFRTWSNAKCPYRLKRWATFFSLGSLGIQRGAPCICSPLPVHILRISRQIYQEAFDVLYSQNKFVVDLPRWVSLLTNGLDLDQDRFGLLSRHAISKVRSVQFTMTHCPCVGGHECPGMKENCWEEGLECSVCHIACKRGSGRPLSAEEPTSQALFELWRSLCAVLRSSGSALAKLTVIGDCKDLQTAREVTTPLQGFPTLESCSIRLGQSPNDDELMKLAEATANNLTARHPPAIFPFGRLPEEIQEMILTHTDLVSPLYLSWNEVGRDRQARKSLHYFQDLGVVCCLRCTEMSEVCTCPIHHAAYTTNSCTCWRFPSAMFLVNRQVNKLATRVFFSQNKFVLFDSALYGRHDENGMSHLRVGDGYLADQTTLLRSLPERSLSHLRWLRLNFRSFYSSDCLPGTPGHEAWTRLTSIIKAVAQISALTVELDLADGVGDMYHYPEMSDAEVEEKWLTYQNIVGLFKAAPTDATGRNDESASATLYRDFFIRLGSPQPYSAENDLLRWQREQELERRIMGADYNAAARGKYTKRAEGFYQRVKFHREPVYGPDGVRLNPVDVEDRASCNPDEGVRPRLFELSGLA